MSRFVVCMSWGGDRVLLPPAVAGDRAWAFGGERSMYELAAAAAASGLRAEVRGNCLPTAVRETAAAAGVEVTLPGEADEPRPDDVVVISEGHADREFFRCRALAPSRNVLHLLAPPGLFGWDFSGGWQPRDPLDVDPDAVGTPSQLAAAARMGFELWTNNRNIAAVAEAAGVPCRDVRNGWPAGPPDVTVERTTDVAIVTDNRWGALAEAAVAGMASVDRIPTLPHDQLLRRIAAARVLVHLPRVEGDSRIAAEARALGTVPVGLRSNRFAIGLREELGGLAVDTPGDVEPVVRELLDDPARLARLSQAGRDGVRRGRRWADHVARVRLAVAAAQAAA